MTTPGAQDPVPSPPGYPPGYPPDPVPAYMPDPLSDPLSDPLPHADTGRVVPSSDERTLACLAHVLGAFVSFIAPLVIFLTRDRRDYAKVQAAEALNFTITVAIGYVVSGLLCLVLIGFVLLPIVGIWSVVMAIVAAVKTYNGEPFRYPLTIPFVRV